VIHVTIYIANLQQYLLFILRTSGAEQGEVPEDSFQSSSILSTGQIFDLGYQIVNEDLMYFILDSQIK